MSDHGAAIRSSIPDAKPSGPRGHVAHEPRRALIVPEPETDGPATEPSPSLPGRLSASAEQQRVKMRQRIARFGSSRPQTPALDPLFRIVRANHPKADLDLRRARLRGRRTRSHEGQMRKSGEPYITHPLAVATILAELGHGHDRRSSRRCCTTPSKTPTTPSTHAAARVRRRGRAAGRRRDQARQGQLRRGRRGRDDPQDGRRDGQDIRVLVIKLADRLHNMRTLRYLPPDKQARKARETLEIFAPLAHRLGMNTIKWELEDLSFATLHPKVYDEIVRLVAERAPSRDTVPRRASSSKCTTTCARRKIKASVTGAAEALLLDLSEDDRPAAGTSTRSTTWSASAILVETVRDCYAALGVLHAAGPRCRAGSRTTSRCRSSTCTSRCTPR